ncbi:hypothetical protein L1887_36511 [Cichorium endivia]|nr:hypothetical protein L1887_36511 [Cichorium endivia]
MLSLSIILMMTMIKDCDGWMTPCNGTAECYRIFEIHEELEFLMDTEVNRRILGTANSEPITYEGLERNKPVCKGPDCGGEKYNAKGERKCEPYDHCNKIRTGKQNREAFSTTIQEQQAISKPGTKIGKKIGSLPYLCNQMERRREVRREAAERRCAGEAVAATGCELD